MPDGVRPASEPHERRSIRNIPVPAERRHPPRMTDAMPPRRRRSRSFWLWAIVVAVVCIVGGMFVAGLFSGATITVYPRTAVVNPPPTLIAQAASNTAEATGTLAYTLMSTGQSAQRTVPAQGTTNVNTTAQGSITILNDYSTAPQKLITNTRFEAPDGKIYRIHSAVTVPGATKKADGTLSPGSVAVIAYADQPGPDYNRGQTTFTIPGFQGDPRYSAFSATTDGISGGMSGIEPAVSATNLANAKSQMEQELSQGLSNSSSGQLPKGYIAIPGTIAITYGAITTTDAGGGNALLTETATGTEAMVRSSDLASAIAQYEVQGYQGEPIDFSDSSSLSVAVASGTSYTLGSSNVTLVLSGTANLIWQFDTAKLQQSLAGKNKSEFDSIVKTFAPAIAKATASLRPFWKTTFPSNPAQITITTETTGS